MLRLPSAAPRRGGVRRAPLVTLLALGAFACDRGNAPVLPTYTLLVRAGDEQTAQAGNRAAVPLQVTVTSAAAEPATNVKVQFRVLPGGDATLDDSVAVSGPGGVAAMGLRMGTSHPDTAQVRAFVRGQEERGVTFTVVASEAPVLMLLTPSPFAAGDTVALRGRWFSPTLAETQVFFGQTRGTVVDVSGDTLLRVVAPPCAAGDVSTVRLRTGDAESALAGVTYAGSPGGSLAPLQGAVLPATQVGDCLRLPGDGARYLLVPQYASESDPAASPVAYTVASNAGAPSAVVAGAAAPAASRGAQFDFDMRMRRLEQELAPRTAVEAAEIRAEGPARLEALEVGSRRTFSVLSSLSGDVTFKQNTATLKYVGAHTLLYYDTLAPNGAQGGFSDAQLRDFGKLFDETLYDIGVRNFGSESDIDGNGKVIVLMSSVVNSLSRRDCSQGAVIGFFYPHDFTRGGGSNRGEVLYTLVPDPTARFDCAHSLADVQSLTPATMLHEFQHMISHNQHVLARRGPAENVWLNEGLSTLAEELASRHYEDRCPPPACRSTPTQTFPDSSQDFILNPLKHAFLYLNAPTAWSVTTFREFGSLQERGGAWLFLRWLVDQKGEQIIPRLVQTSRTSIANVEFVAGESFPSLFGDFGIAAYADSLPGVRRTAIPERYRFKTRNLRALFARLNAVGEVPSAFPIVIPSTKRLAVPGAVSGSTVPGSMDFLLLETASGSSAAALRFAPPSGSSFPAALRAQIGILRLP